jgi:hypothetical protein
MTFHLRLFFISIVILLLSLGMAKSVPAAGVNEPLTMAMEATGAQLEEFSINAWVKLPNGELSDDQLTELVRQVMEELGVTSQNYQLTQQQKNNQHSMQAEIVSPTFHALAVAQRVPGGIGALGNECYLVVTIEEKTATSFAVSRDQGEIRRIIKKFGSSPHISTCLIGWLNGKLRDGEQHDLLHKAFSVIDAKIINELEAERFVSYTGFASGITEWLRVDDEKINLNMAMRYSQYDNRTYVTVGSPIITREY